MKKRSMRRWASRPASILTPFCRSAIRWDGSGPSAADRSRMSSISTGGANPIRVCKNRREEIMPRITPVSGKADVPAQYHGVVDEVVKVFGQVRGPFSIMLHSPELAHRVLPLVTFFREGSLVEVKLRSHAILAAVREKEAAYVWAAQVGAA